jgi:hypothetical protein
MLSRIFGGLIATAMLASGVLVAAAPANAAVECGTLKSEQLGGSPNTVYTHLGKTYIVNVTLYGEHDPNFNEICDLKLIMKVTVPSGGIVTKGHVNLGTNDRTVNTTPTNDVAGGTKSYDSGWLPGNCMTTGLGLWNEPGTSGDTQFLTAFGNGTTCF